MSLDAILSLVGLLFAVLGFLTAIIFQAVGSERADVPVLLCFLVMLVCQTVRLVCWRELDAIPPVMAGMFAVIVWLTVVKRRNGGS